MAHAVWSVPHLASRPSVCSAFTLPRPAIPTRLLTRGSWAGKKNRKNAGPKQCSAPRPMRILSAQAGSEALFLRGRAGRASAQEIERGRLVRRVDLVPLLARKLVVLYRIASKYSRLCGSLLCFKKCAFCLSFLDLNRHLVDHWESGYLKRDATSNFKISLHVSPFVARYKPLQSLFFKKKSVPYFYKRFIISIFLCRLSSWY